MDVGTFVTELLQALANVELFERVDLNTEGLIVDGHVYVRNHRFGAFTTLIAKVEPPTSKLNNMPTCC